MAYLILVSIDSRGRLRLSMGSEVKFPCILESFMDIAATAASIAPLAPMLCPRILLVELI